MATKSKKGNNLKSFWRCILDDAFPGFCLVCQERLYLNEKTLCLSCFEEIFSSERWVQNYLILIEKPSLIKYMQLPKLVEAIWLLYCLNQDTKDCLVVYEASFRAKILEKAFHAKKFDQNQFYEKKPLLFLGLFSKDHPYLREYFELAGFESVTLVFLF